MIDLGFDVSRETIVLLQEYAKLLRKWSPKINLISKPDLLQLETRHIIDSAQLYPLVDGWETWVDFGSGGGLPGLVVAILCKSAEGPQTVTMIESDQRKATFLRTAIRELDLPATVVSKRIEDCAPFQADVVSARALAPLPKLLDYAKPFLSENTVCLFPKGKSWQSELESAEVSWSFECDEKISKTNPESVVLKLEALRMAGK